MVAASPCQEQASPHLPQYATPHQKKKPGSSVFCCLLTVDSSSLPGPPSPPASPGPGHPLQRGQADAQVHPPGDVLACDCWEGTHMPRHHLGRTLPPTRITVAGFRRFLILFFKKCQRCAQHMWISKHDRGGQSVLFWSGGGGRREGKKGHMTRPRPTSRASGSRGGAGWLHGASWGPREGGSGTPSHAPHSLACTPCTHCCHPADTPPLCTQLPWNPGAPSLGPQHPRERRSPAHCLHHTEDTAQRRARHILQVLQMQRS